MALIQTEMNVVNSGGTSDVIVPNAIANSDGTSSGLSQDANNVLKVDGTEIVSKKKLLWSGDLSNSSALATTGISVNISSAGLTYKQNTHYEIQGYYSTTSGTYKNYWQTSWYYDNGQGSPYARKGTAFVFGSYENIGQDAAICGVDMSSTSVLVEIYIKAITLSGVDPITASNKFSANSVIGITAIYEITE